MRLLHIKLYLGVMQSFSTNTKSLFVLADELARIYAKPFDLNNRYSLTQQFVESAVKTSGDDDLISDGPVHSRQRCS